MLQSSRHPKLSQSPELVEVHMRFSPWHKCLHSQFCPHSTMLAAVRQLQQQKHNTEDLQQALQHKTLVC
jgi:hypothetical protein